MTVNLKTTMNNNELLQLMTDSADDAVIVSRDQFKIALDFSPASVSLVDAAINLYLDTYKAQALEDKAVFTICNMYGAYVGETFRRIKGGSWILDKENDKSPNVFLAKDNNTYAFAGICYEKLVNNSAVSISEYFDQAIASHSAPH